MDVITAHQAGYSNCVATLGTALTPEHIKLLARYASRVVLAYDADSAGMKATMRSAAMFEEAESEVRIARLPSGDDPDSLLRKGRVSEFDAAISNALPVPDYRLAVLRDKYDLSDPMARTKMLQESARVLADVQTYAERERLIKSLARYHPNFETGTTRAEDHIRRDVEALLSRRQGTVQQGRGVTNAPKVLSALDRAENAVLRTLLIGENSDRILGSLSPESFSTDIRKKAAVLLFEKFREKKGIYLPEIINATDSDTGRYLSELAMQENAEPVNEALLGDCIALIENSRLKRLRTSDVLAPYMNKDGNIDPSNWPHGQTAAEFEEFLRKSGKKPDARTS